MKTLTPIDHSTNKIKEVLAIDNHHLRELMFVSQKEFNSFKDDFSKAPPWAIHSLASKLGITLENLLTGHIDYEALKEHFNGNLSFLPKKYQIYRESRFRTIQNLLDGLDPLYKSVIVNKLQLNSSHFDSPDNKVCGLALIDAQVEIKRLGLSLSSIESFGYLSSQKYKPLLVTSSMERMTNTKKFFNAIMTNVNETLERNMHYEITQSGHNSILMSVTTREELKDNLKRKHFGTTEHCANIKGWAKGILEYRKGCKGNVKKLSCVHYGDQTCQYEIDYSFAH